MTQNDIPKLFVNADRGALINGSARDFVRPWPNITELNRPSAADSTPSKEVCAMFTAKRPDGRERDRDD